MGGICYSVQELSYTYWTDEDQEEIIFVAKAGEHVSQRVQRHIHSTI
jgi:hypothetical protein